MKTGTYTNRDRQHIALRCLRPIPFAPGFWYGDRVDNGQLLQVHEHRLQFDPDPDPATNPWCTAVPQPSNPS